MAGMYNFRQGDTFTLSGTVSATENGSAVTDFTGYTGTARAWTRSGDLLATLTFAWVDAATGVATISYPDTATWPLDTLAIDVTVTSGAGVVTTTPFTRIRVTKFGGSGGSLKITTALSNSAQATLSPWFVGPAGPEGPSGDAGIADGDKGDITVSSSGATWTIDNGAVTLAKMADMATASLIGRDTAGTGVPEVLSAADARTLLDVDSSGTDNSTDVTLAGSLDYLTIAGQEITRNAIVLTTDVTGILPIANIATGTPDGSKFVRDDGTLQTIAGGGDALVANPLSQFAATTSAQLAGVLSDETGSGAAVFANSPTLVTPALGTPSALVLTNATGLPIAAIGDGTITLAKQADLAADLIIGRANGAGTGVPVGLTATQVRTIINVEAGADVTDAGNVTAAGALMDSEVTNLAQVKAFDATDYATAAQGATADSAQQPPSEGAFANGDKTKLDGIEASADVTDTTNVTAAGALMDSELASVASVKALDQGVAVADSPQFAGVNIGHATDTTLTRSGAGQLAVEGVDVAMQGAIVPADLANGTDGELITWDASGAPAVVAAGTATHVLTSNGAGAAPTFQAAAGGGGGGGLQPYAFKTTSGTWTKPAGLVGLVVYVVGGGGGGGSANSGSSDSGQAGCSGAFLYIYIDAASLGATEDYTIGAGGAGGAAGSNNGVAGGDSDFGTTPIVTAGGGTSGFHATHGSRTSTVVPATASGGDYNFDSAFIGSANVTNEYITSGSEIPHLFSPFTASPGYSVTAGTAGKSASDVAPDWPYGLPGGGADGNGSSDLAGGDGAAGIIILQEVF